MSDPNRKYSEEELQHEAERLEQSMPTHPTPEKIAEELAEKCARTICKQLLAIVQIEDYEYVRSKILSTLNLKELVEDKLRLDYLESRESNSIIVSDRFDWDWNGKDTLRQAIKAAMERKD